jgi:antitoxin component of RelBE/YafQ-DinJ toxin-antitoxin module
MSDTSTIHVPLEPSVRKKFTAQAKQLGFDSAQAYLRVLIKAAIDGRRIDLDIDEWGQPSDEAAARLNKAAKDARLNKDLSGPFKSVDDFMKDL